MKYLLTVLNIAGFLFQLSIGTISDAPSESPSQAPSLVPTNTPTPAPTTVSPSIGPTHSPSNSPSVVPTLSPSVCPSLVPTLSPSVEPSLTPSQAPTVQPSILPTAAPTEQITAFPTTTLDTTKYYSVNTADAYTWKYGYPQSCECVENDVTKKDCSLFKCLCSCDINAGQCDFGCCCDPDCSSDQISRFSELDACDNAGYTSSRVQYCYSSKELYAVNPRSPLGGQSTAKDALSSALCVVKTNYASEGHYFTDTDLQSSSIFGESSGQKDYSYIPNAPTALVADSFFDQNDSIAAFLSTSASSLVSNGPGYFQLPTPDFSGSCNDNNFVTFENNVDLTECVRGVSTTESIFVSQCESQFSVGRFVNDLYIARTPTVSASSGVADFTDVVNVTLTSVTFEDFATGEQFDITSTWTTVNCQTTAYTNASGTAAYDANIDSNICSSSSTAAKSLMKQSAAMCAGFIKGVYYTVTHNSDATGSITGVTAAVVVTDVPMTMDGAVGVTQAFGVEFSSAYSGGVSSDNGNLVKRQRSGNPGYVMGLPVLYGFLNSVDTSVVDELVEGLSVPSAIMSFDPNFPTLFGRAVCPQQGQTAGSTPLTFGYDMATGCTMELTRQELINLCCQGSTACAVGATTGTSSYSDTTSGIPYFLDFTQGYVGVFGDADPLDVTQWSQIGYSDPQPTRIWNDKTSTCSSMYSGINVKFLVTSSGEKMNPQNKIVAALAELVTSDWVLSTPAGDDSSTQTFALTSTVTFVFEQENLYRRYEPPAPPVLFKVPYDVFYPVLKPATNSAPRSGVSSLTLGVTVALVSFCTMVIGMFSL